MNPESEEHADGPKNVKAVFSIDINAFVTSPQTKDCPNLKLQVDGAGVPVFVQFAQEGKKGGSITIVSCTTIESFGAPS